MINEKFPNTEVDGNGAEPKSEFTKYSKIAPTLNADDLRERN
jgi:hypothetical protein